MDFQKFIDNYKQDDLNKIKFSWNGEYADKFEDKNVDFRYKLSEYIIPNIENVNLALLVDLYVEHSRYAEKAWCVYNKYQVFANEILTRGKTKYLLEYLDASRMCFDTFLASQVAIDENIKIQFSQYLKELKRQETDKHILKIIDFGLDRFDKK
ncbi:MAG: hypothetical protein ACK5LP_10135 [Campylobacteraceae bacterium]